MGRERRTSRSCNYTDVTPPYITLVTPWSKLSEVWRERGDSWVVWCNRHGHSSQARVTQVHGFGQSFLRDWASVTEATGAHLEVGCHAIQWVGYVPDFVDWGSLICMIHSLVLECVNKLLWMSAEHGIRSVKAQGPMASDNLNPLLGFNVATIVYVWKIEKEKCFLPRLIFGW